MIQNIKLSKRAACTLATLVAVPIFSVASMAEDWRFSVGTGIFALNMDGDLGVGDSKGSAKSEFDLDFDDVLDLNETSGGLLFSAGKGVWNFNVALAYLELEGDERDDNDVFESKDEIFPANYELNFTKSFADVSAGYAFYNVDQHKWRVIGGLRYHKHEWELKAPIDGVLTKPDSEEDWTDAYIGVGYTYRINDALAWDTRIDAGAGGADVTYAFNTGLTWGFTDHWAASVYARSLTIDYEENSEGDRDWYLYDADEFGIGLGIAVRW